MRDPGTPLVVPPLANRGRVPLKEAGDDTYYCPELDPDVTATIAGVSGEIVADGGWMCLGTGGPACATPRLEIAIPTDLHPATAEVVVSSGTYSHTFPLGDALAPRTIVPVGQSDLMFRSGQPITLRWSTAADFAKLTATSVGFLRTTGDTFGLGEADITRTADTITFTPPQRMGAGRLVVTLSGSVATDTFVSQLAYLDVTFVP
jgi:hypothetical protein